MKNISKIILWLSLLLVQANSALAMNIAITVDDLPTAGVTPHNVKRKEITDKMLLALQKHHIEGVYGFINADKLTDSPMGLTILKEWMNAGHLLGNHTYSHLDLDNTGVNTYKTNIKMNEPTLSQLMVGKNYHYFRYPYLAEGNTQYKRDAIRQYLFKNHYKIAPVTVDFFDYAWNEPYVRCMNKHDDQAIAWLKSHYIQYAVNALTIAHELSKMLFDREIDHVLLIHINAFTSEMLDELLTEYEKHQVKFIALPEALHDKVYQLNPNVIKERTYTFLNQVRLSHKLNNPAIVAKLYETFPEKKLAQLCR